MPAMHVAVASHHRLPVEGYGGTQRVVVALVRGLAALGHRVTLIAQPGTRVAEASALVELPPKRLRDPSLDLTPFVPKDADILHAHFPVHRAPQDVREIGEHTSELQSPDHLVCRLLLEKKKKKNTNTKITNV